MKNGSSGFLCWMRVQLSKDVFRLSTCSFVSTSTAPAFTFTITVYAAENKRNLSLSPCLFLSLHLIDNNAWRSNKYNMGIRWLNTQHFFLVLSSQKLNFHSSKTGVIQLCILHSSMRVDNRHNAFSKKEKRFMLAKCQISLVSHTYWMLQIDQRKVTKSPFR